MPRTTALLLALGLSGCSNPLEFSDDIDLSFDFGLLDGRADNLHTPYVQGAPVTLYAFGKNNLEGWRIESANPDVFRIDGWTFGEDLDSLDANALAAGAGVTEILVYDERDRLVDSAEIEVELPDAVELHASGPLFTHLDRGATITDRPQVLVGGLATFQVRYFNNGQQLFGNSTLGTRSSDTALETEEDTTWLFENREWVRFNPGAAGTYTVDLSADGIDFTTVTVEAVQAADMESMALIAESERNADDGDHLVVLAQSYDSAGVEVYGVEYEWERNGFGESGLGDLYRYTFDDTEMSDLSAEFDGMSDTIVIHGDGYVDSSNNLGCNTLRKGATAAWLLVLPLIGFRRRRP